MRSRDQVIWDFVQSWLAKGERDLHAAEILLAGPGEHGEAVGFHCQQAAEKFLKAYLVRHQIEFSKTHDLGLLRRLISGRDEPLAERLAFADWLTPFGVEARYPGEIPEVDRQTAERAFVDAKQARHLVLDALDEYLGRGRPRSQQA
jgi:HEPN domain-containing protein